MKKLFLLLLLFSFVGINATPKEVDVYKDQPTTIFKSLDATVSVALISADDVEKQSFKQYNDAVFFETDMIKLTFLKEIIVKNSSWQNNYISIVKEKTIKPPLTNYCFNQNLLDKSYSRKQPFKNILKQRFKNSLFICS